MFQFPSFSFRNVSDVEMDFTYSAFLGSGFTFSGFGSRSGSQILESFSTEIAGSLDLLDINTIANVFRSQFLSPTITGTSRNDSLRGTAGDDVFFGGAGRDTFYGGFGNDTYFVTSSRQRVSEKKNQGDDTVVSFADSYSLPKNVEYLVLGGSGDSSGTGNNLNNILLGNIGNNLLKGQGGSDFLYGFEGADTLYGGGGNDFLWGGLGDDALYGGNGDDVLDGGAGNDLLDGGDGYDTAIFAGTPTDYTYVGTAGNLVVRSSTGETDILQNMETIEFTEYNFDLGSLLAGAFPSDTTIDLSSSTGDTAPTDTRAEEDPVFDVIVDEPVIEPDIIIVEDAPATEDPVQVALADTFSNSSSTKTGQITFEAANAKAIGGIVAVTFENNQSSAIDANIETFGHVFVAGDLMPGETLQAKIGDQFVPVQVNVKATHDDGSVRHAILTMESPSLSAGESIDAILMKGGSGPDGTAITAADVLASTYSFTAKLDFYNDDGSKTTYTVNAEDLLASSLADGSLETWLSGPMTSEFSVKTKVTDHLEMRFDIRMDSDGNIRTDFAVGNESAYTAGIETFTYDITLAQNGTIVFAEPAIPHHRNSNWHVQTWTDGEPQAHVKFDVDYMADSGAIPHYETSLGIDAAELGKGSGSDFGPMGNGTIMKVMPTTGGRDDIGLLSAWTTDFIITQDETAFDLMIGNADAAGSVPWHILDEATGAYVSVIDHPDLWIDYRQTSGEDALATPYKGLKSETGWKVDTAHAPSLSFVPYLVSGDKYHLDNLQAQATYSIGRVKPGQRDNSEGDLLFVDGSQQVRASAWSIRTVSDAAFVTPDDHLLQNLFGAAVSDSLDYLVTKYIVNGEMDAYGDLEGFFWDPMINSSGSDAGRTSPWMQDYLITSLGLAAGRGYDQADDLLEWSLGFHAERFTSAEEGFDPMFGAAYRYQLTDPDTGTKFTNWQDVFDATFGAGATRDTLKGGTEKATGYAASAMASMSALVTYTGSADAVESYAYLLADSVRSGAFSEGNTKGYLYESKWLLTPTMSDGSPLKLEDVQVGSSSNGTASNDFLYGDSNANTINGSSGVDWVFGADGNDTVQGGAGDDYVFGNAGNDVVAGNSGNDILKGGSGADTFVFVNGDGSDVVEDFDLSEDLLSLSSDLGDGSLSRSEVISMATQNDEGVVIDFGGGDDLLLKGISLTDLLSLNIEIA